MACNYLKNDGLVHNLTFKCASMKSLAINKFKLPTERWQQIRAHTLKKLINEGSSGASVAVKAVDDGSSGPSMIDKDGTASSSSNSLE